MENISCSDIINVQISIRAEDEGTFGSILETGFAGGTAPDIIQLKSGQRSTFGHNLLNLRRFLNEPNPHDTRGLTWADNFVGGIEAFPTEDNGVDANSILFIPNDGNPDVFAGRVLVFNRYLVRQAGLDPDSPPVTWTDYFIWLEALNTLEGVEPIAGDADIGGKVSQMGYMFCPDFATRFFHEDFSAPELKDALFWDKLYILTCYEGGSQLPLLDLPFYSAMFGLMRQHLSYYQCF